MVFWKWVVEAEPGLEREREREGGSDDDNGAIYSTHSVQLVSWIMIYRTDINIRKWKNE